MITSSRAVKLPFSIADQDVLHKKFQWTKIKYVIMYQIISFSYLGK